MSEGKNVLECPMNLSSPSDLGLPAADEMAKSGMIDCLFLALIPVSATFGTKVPQIVYF